MADVTLLSSRFGVVGGFASAGALDAVRAPAGARACRIASDEIAFVCQADAATDVLDAIAPQIVRGDSDGFALDLSDGWTGFTLTGDVARAFSYLSELQLPGPGAFVQGDVLRVPVRVLTGENQIDLLVPSPWGTYLHDEMLDALRTLNVQDDSETA
ncbi:MAG: hypothetical protein JRE38_13430 [Deltaproteobacteria bacterium]|nr:hypothetical protein [Deltaproteobacteria bacterium]